MPKGERKDYSAEYKLAAVMMMKSGSMRPKDVLAALGGIDRQTVYRWVKEYDEKGEAAFREERAVLPAKQIAELQKENKALREENEILKKAAAYFAEQRKKL
jgi:transposase